MTNITTAAAAEIVDDLAAARPVLLAAGDPRVWSDVDKKNHKLILAPTRQRLRVQHEFTQGGPATADAAMRPLGPQAEKPVDSEIPGDLYNLNFYDETGVWARQMRLPQTPTSGSRLRDGYAERSR